MSTQLHSMRRMGLLAGIGLAVTVAVVILWRLQLQAAPSAASDLAAHPGAAASDQMLIANQLAGALPFSVEQLDDQNTTAVLFLIDESGGVSGRCDAVNPSDVFVTDAEGRRYELVRFYLQLWRAYYTFLRDRGDLDDASLLIQMGVMQFAKANEPQVLLNITSIGDLLDDLGATKFERLQSQDTMLTGIDANWFCWTNFSSALDGAAEELNNSGAENKTLVLLTDGSTRGNENEQECEENNEACLAVRLADRSVAREATEQALRRLKASNIEPLVVIWQGNDCQEEMTCGLSENEFSMRKDDLARWESWEKAGLLTLISDEQAIKALAENPSIAPLLPGVGQYATGWIDGTTDQTIRSFFSEVARLLKVIVITSDDTNPSNIIFRPQSISDGNPPTSFSRLSFQSQESQWYLAESNITGSTATCPQRALEISINEPVLAYYWLPFEQDWPKIKSVSVEPEEIKIDRLVAGAIPSEDRTIKVTVQMEPIDMNHHNCFLVQVSVGGNTYAEHLPSDKSQFSFPAIILPDDLAHGPTAISAQLVFANAPEVSAGVERTAKLNVVFQPIFPSTIDISSSLALTTSDAITVTIPVTFANRIPGFEPHFYGLFPDDFDPYKASPPPAGTPGPTQTPGELNCPITQPLDEASLAPVALTTGPTSWFVTNYVFIVPRHGIARCGYRYLLTMWTDSSGPAHRSIHLMSSTFATIKETLQLAETPMATPIPETKQDDNGGHGLSAWKWGVVILVVVVGAVVLVWKKPWRRKPG